MMSDINGNSLPVRVLTYADLCSHLIFSVYIVLCVQLDHKYFENQ